MSSLCIRKKKLFFMLLKQKVISEVHVNFPVSYSAVE